MSFTIESLEEMIAQRREQLNKLEDALATIRDVFGSSQGLLPAHLDTGLATASAAALASGRHDLTGKTIREAAHVILTEAEVPLDPREVAKKALARGYRAPRADANFATTVKSFSDIMRTDKALSRDSQRRFSFHRKQSKPTQPASNTQHGKSRADAIAALMRDRRSPMTIAEIRDGLIAGNHRVPTEPRSAHNSIFGTLKHASELFRSKERGLWELKEGSDQSNGAMH